MYHSVLSVHELLCVKVKVKYNTSSNIYLLLTHLKIRYHQEHKGVTEFKIRKSKREKREGETDEEEESEKEDEGKMKARKGKRRGADRCATFSRS